jgi:hypothetical protein
VDELYFNISGDMHFERVQYGIAARFEDNQQCIDAVVKATCRDPACRGLILTGDNFNKKTLLPRHQILFNDIHSRIRAAGKEMWAIDGNHDGSDASWLDTIDPRINGNNRILQLGSKPAAFFSFQERAHLYERLKKIAGAIQVLVLHGRLLELLTWARAQKEPDYDFSAQELRDLGMRHCTVFMGDLHTYSDFYDPAGDNWFIYAGSTEMTEISEGNVISQRFGNRYDTVKKYIRFFPDRPHGENWVTVDLPNRPFLRRVIASSEDANLAIASLDRWVSEHPKGILAIHYPFSLRDALQPCLARWKASLLALSDVPLSASMAKPLQEMREIDILTIAEKELNPEQIQVLKVVLTNEHFDSELKRLLSPETAS